MSAYATSVGVVAALAVGGAVAVGWQISEEPLEKSPLALVEREDEPVAASDVSPSPRDASSREEDGTAPMASETFEGPKLSMMRVDRRGGAVVAGMAAPQEEIVLRVDGVEVARARTDRHGDFVALFDMALTDASRLLTLEAVARDGSVRVGVEGIVVAPTASAFASADEVAAQLRPPTVVRAAEPASGRKGDAPVPPPQLPRLETTRPPDLSIASEGATAGGPPSSSATAVLRSPAASASDNADERASEDAGSSTGTPVQPPRLFRLGPDGLSVEASAGPAPSAQDLGIDVISYDLAGGVQIAGRAQGDADLRILLDGRTVQRLRSGPDGAWVSQLPEIDTGTYRLRIETVGADGTVTDSVETPFQRTAPEVAAQARRDGAEAITVQTGFTLWALSEGYYGDGERYVRLYEANRDQIRDPDLIFPGQVFRLPRAEE
jgi:nucleoid-associated protein YgaU